MLHLYNQSPTLLIYYECQVTKVEEEIEGEGEEIETTGTKGISTIPVEDVREMGSGIEVGIEQETMMKKEVVMILEDKVATYPFPIQKACQTQKQPRPILI